MVERRSPLANFLHDIRERAHDLPGSSALVLRDIQAGSVVHVAAWPDTVPAVEAVIRDLLGLDPAPPGRFSGGENACVATLSPGRYLVIADQPALAARFEAGMLSSQGAAADLTHGRAMLRLQGDCAADVLAKGCAIDFEESAFPSGRVVQTLLGHFDVTLLRRDAQTFEIMTLRGFVESLAEWLLDAGLEYEIVLAGGAH
jgi:sarcosine oxidase subunit gamma